MTYLTHITKLLAKRDVEEDLTSDDAGGVSITATVTVLGRYAVTLNEDLTAGVPSLDEVIIRCHRPYSSELDAPETLEARLTPDEVEALVESLHDAGSVLFPAGPRTNNPKV